VTFPIQLVEVVDELTHLRVTVDRSQVGYKRLQLVDLLLEESYPLVSDIRNDRRQVCILQVALKLIKRVEVAEIVFGECLGDEPFNLTVSAIPTALIMTVGHTLLTLDNCLLCSECFQSRLKAL